MKYHFSPYQTKKDWNFILKVDKRVMKWTCTHYLLIAVKIAVDFLGTVSLFDPVVYPKAVETRPY